MENWVKLDPETLAAALEGRSVTACGEWIIGFQAGASGAMLHRNSSEDESAGHAAGTEARAQSIADRQRVKDSKRAAGQLGNAKRWGDRKHVAEVSRCDDFASRKTIAEVSPREERRGEEIIPLGGDNAQAREPPPETPEWKLNKAEAARRKIAAIRPTIDRLESRQALTAEARAKLEQAKADVYELETEIYGLGLRP